MIPPAPTSLSDSDGPDRAWPRDGLLLGITLLAALTPIWFFHYFPTTDGGAHIANADVLLQYFRPAGEAYRKYYQLSHAPLPNSLGHFLLAAFMLVFPPLTAEKILVSLYLILLPLAVRYAATAINKSSAFLAILAVPLSLNWILHAGFYNFCCSVVIFFFTLGYWLRWREQLNPRRVVTLALLALLLYAGHLLSVVLGCASIVMLAVWFTIAQWRQERKVNRAASLWPGIRSTIHPTLHALLPAIALFLWFQIVHQFKGQPAGLKIAILQPEFWKNLLGLSIQISYRASLEWPFARATAILVIALAVCRLIHRLRTRTWNRLDGLLLLPLAFVALYFTRGDEDSKTLFIPQRLIFYTYLTTLLFLAGDTHRAWMKRSVQVIALLLTAGLTAAHWPSYREYNAQLSEFVGTAEKIEPGSTLLPLAFSQFGQPLVSDLRGLRVSPFYTAAGYAAVDRKAIDLRNYEAGLDYFPVQFRAELNPYQHLAVIEKGHNNGLNEVPQRFDIAAYERRTAGRVDYVLVWGVTEALRNHPDAINTFEQLRAGYEILETSSTHRAELWRRRSR